jgi:hypothetical protein
MTTISLAIIYWILGIAASFSVGVAIGAIIGAFRSLFNITKSRTAWFATLTFLFIAFIAINLAIGTLPVAGNLGDRTGYNMQSMLLLGAIIPGLFTWIFPISMLAIGSKKLALSNSFSPYAFVYSFLIFYSCGMLGGILVLAYISVHWSPPMTLLSLIFYPATFFIAPFVMLLRDGIWLPLVLHFGGVILASFPIIAAGLIAKAAEMVKSKKT